VLPQKGDFLDHVKWLRRAAAAAGAEFILAGDSLQVLLRHGSRHWALAPQFLTSLNGVDQYTAELHDETEMFAGWLPYRGKRWPLSDDKLAFKRFAAAAGLLVPNSYTEPAGASGGLIIKRIASSFGRDLQGPFRSSAERPLDHAQAEYYEQFLRGDLLKLWFWNGSPICAEHDQMSFVEGDGVSSIRALVERQLSYRSRPLSTQRRAELLQTCATLLQYLEVGWETVPARGERQLVDFRYTSPLRHPAGRQVLDLTSPREPGWLPMARRAGQRLFAGIPEAVRDTTIFTADAILDESGQVWFLEMNSNPVVHPLLYPHIVESLLGSESPTFDLAQSQPAARQLS
jgi:hypothetical protein